MKRFLASLLVGIMLISNVGCSSTQEDNNKKGEESIKTEESVHEEENTEIQYNDEQALFMAQDRCDIEGDKYSVYFYNHNGELLSSSDSSPNIGYYAENGLAPAADPNSGNVGFVDKDGVFQIEPKYEDAAPFSKDDIALVKVRIEKDGDYVEKCGYINSKGKEITPCIYDEATSFFNCGYAIAGIKIKNDDQASTDIWEYYIIDQKGKQIIKINTENDERRITGVYADYFICSTDNGMAIYNYSNKKLLETNYSSEKVSETQYISYSAEIDGIYRNTYDITNIQNPRTIKKERFDGKKFIEEKTEYKITSKHVATTQSGLGYGIVKDEKTVVPFEYDEIFISGEYFVAIKYTGDNKRFDQIIDIYDKNYNKTAENLEYAFSNRSSAYGKECQLPNGYFQIIIEDDDYNYLNGIIDYTGKIIVEPVFGRGITLCTYEGTGNFLLF